MGTRFAQAEAEITRCPIDPDVLGAVSSRPLPDFLAFDEFRGSIHNRLMKITSLEHVESIRYAVVANRLSLEGVMGADPRMFPGHEAFALATEEQRDAMLLHASRILCAAAGQSALRNSMHLREYFVPEAVQESSLKEVEYADIPNIVDAYVEEQLFRTHYRELFKVLRT